MLPFHKRVRNSVYEIDAAELEPVDLPPVRPPNARPGRPVIEFARDDERTLLLPEKRRSSAPPPRTELRFPRVPAMGALPKFSPSLSMSDEVTMVRPGSRRSLLTMKAAPAQAPRMSIGSMMREELASSLEPSTLPSAPVTVEPARSSESVPAIAMSAADASAATVLVRNTNHGRPTAVWAMALLALGLFGGLLTSVVTRNELAQQQQAPTQAAQPQQAHVNDTVAVVQAPIVQQQLPAAIADALAPSTACGVDPVPAPPTNPTAKATAVAVAAPPAPVVEAKPVVASAPAKVVRSIPKAAPAVAAPKPDVVAVAKPAKPAPVTKKALGDDMEQANAADALARAQLEAALNR